MCISIYFIAENCMFWWSSRTLFLLWELVRISAHSLCITVNIYNPPPNESTICLWKVIQLAFTQWRVSLFFYIYLESTLASQGPHVIKVGSQIFIFPAGLTAALDGLACVLCLGWPWTHFGNSKDVSLRGISSSQCPPLFCPKYADLFWE